MLENDCSNTVAGTHLGIEFEHIIRNVVVEKGKPLVHRFLGQFLSGCFANSENPISKYFRYWTMFPEPAELKAVTNNCSNQTAR